MSTFAVFGMTLDVAMAEARKTVKTTRPDPKRPGHKIELSVDDWLYKVAQKAEQIMGGVRVKQLSPLFDAPQYAEHFIELARKGSKCRDMRIKAKRTLVDAQGKLIINPKTKAPKVGFTEWPLSQESNAA
ncbi:hypothetical protein N2A98_15455 [Pseudomonas sp. FJ2-5-13]|uniref:hypothetical protein n=1 Tax=Pseudomonas sp. FJ2-5-13 TaxID=2976884 RepID=UPI0023D8B350|nr:hypothetical protein [Pseudomonas sp. FJ2-5-13]WEJ03547.1 hypothetical protein N2A98_15455 [Pseudomonas sp. FJ2-5-13]